MLLYVDIYTKARIVLSYLLAKLSIIERPDRYLVPAGAKKNLLLVICDFYLLFYNKFSTCCYRNMISTHLGSNFWMILLFFKITPTVKYKYLKRDMVA